MGRDRKSAEMSASVKQGGTRCYESVHDEKEVCSASGMLTSQRSNLPMEEYSAFHRYIQPRIILHYFLHGRLDRCYHGLRRGASIQ